MLVQDIYIMKSIKKKISPLIFTLSYQGEEVNIEGIKIESSIEVSYFSVRLGSDFIGFRIVNFDLRLILGLEVILNSNSDFDQSCRSWRLEKQRRTRHSLSLQFSLSLHFIDILHSHPYYVRERIA